jgi:hypothetical protein
MPATTSRIGSTSPQSSNPFTVSLPIVRVGIRVGYPAWSGIIPAG